MGTSRSASELAGKFSRLAAEVPEANRLAVNRSAQLGKEVMLQGAVKAGLRRGGALPSHGKARWGVKTQLGTSGRTSFIGSSSATGAHVAAMLSYTGPVHWAIYGTQDHVIGARGRGGRAAFRRRYARSKANALVGLTGGKGSRGQTLGSGRYRTGKGALALAFGGRFATYATHPGSRGNNTWPETKRRIQTAAPREFRKAHRDAIRRARF
jgi:hypothetical protein